MVSKKQEILDSNNSAGITLIVFLYVSQYRNFDECLLNQLLWFLNDFNCQKLFCFMVEHLQDFSKRASIYRWNDFVSVSNMGPNRILIKLSHIFRILERPFLDWSILSFKVMKFFGLVYSRIFLILNTSSGILSCTVNSIFSSHLKIPTQKVYQLVFFDLIDLVFI